MAKKTGPVDGLLSAAKNYHQKKITSGRNESVFEKVATAFLGTNLQKAYTLFTALPINVQQVVLKVAGLPTSLTEKDLNEQQKKVLYDSIKNAQARTGNKKTGGTEYADYKNGGEKAAAGTTGSKLVKSFTSPDYQIQTTLGRGVYKDTGDSIIFNDRYDFSKAFEKTKNPNLYQIGRKILGRMENQNPTKEDKNDMKVRVALSKKDMENYNKNKS